MGDSDDDDQELEDTAAIREEKMRNLVPALPAEEWGRKTPITPATPANKDGKAVKKVTIADPKTKSSDDKPIKMRPPVFEPQEYDGVISESDDSDDDEPARAGSLGKILGDMKWADMGPQIEDLDGEDEADLDKAARYRSLIIFVSTFWELPFGSEYTWWMKHLALELGIGSSSEQYWGKYSRGGWEVSHPRCRLIVSYFQNVASPRRIAYP